MLIIPGDETEFGKFLRMEPLTLCPIDTTPIMWNMLTNDEKQWLHDYHQRVAKELMPLLDDEADREWLRKNTEM